MRKKNMKKYGSLKSLKKVVGSGVGSGSISQWYRSADPDPHQNVKDPQHYLYVAVSKLTLFTYRSRLRLAPKRGE
jgi:hypothetical protein